LRPRRPSNRGRDLPPDNFKAALKWCQLKPPDAVITDVVLGLEDGIELATQVVKRQPACKVLLTANQTIVSLFQTETIALHRDIQIVAVNAQAILDILASL
jgi:DNA-binding NtrC family response regulator